jgi:CheY-like chemotaxis protein
MIVLRALEAKGHRVEVVSNGSDAVDAVLRSLPDLVLMDNQMPSMSGIEATRAIREHHARLPIIGLSADAMTGDRERFLAAGMNGYLSKPFKTADLHSVIASCVMSGTEVLVGGGPPASL